MSFTSLLNKTCNIEICTKTQCPVTGEIKNTWHTLYNNIKCRIRTRSADERISSYNEYKLSTHAMYLEYLKLDDALTRIVLDGEIYHIKGQLNMGGGHEYLCLYLEVKKQ
ncbi:head-tail adaptor [Elusimicrobium simillimum]|uniref:phage head completion protein n=1 Tax=Elusimicrobium simillimum TaxID=3143438 RepID=UPI003C6F893F